MLRSARTSAAATASGRRKPGKGEVIMVLVDVKGLPVVLNTRAAYSHESKWVQQSSKFTLTRECRIA